MNLIASTLQPEAAVYRHEIPAREPVLCEVKARQAVRLLDLEEHFGKALTRGGAEVSAEERSEVAVLGAALAREPRAVGVAHVCDATCFSPSPWVGALLPGSCARGVGQCAFATR